MDLLVHFLKRICLNLFFRRGYSAIVMVWLTFIPSFSCRIRVVLLLLFSAVVHTLSFLFGAVAFFCSLGVYFTVSGIQSCVGSFLPFKMKSLYVLHFPLTPPVCCVAVLTKPLCSVPSAPCMAVDRQSCCSSEHSLPGLSKAY